MNIVLAVGFEKMEKGNLSQKFADTHRSPTEKHFEQMHKLGVQPGRVNEHMNAFTGDVGNKYFI